MHLGGGRWDREREERVLRAAGCLMSSEYATCETPEAIQIPASSAGVGLY